ncbi:hypothetical protein ACF0H5_019115 [Mactra antiquata]
MGNKVGNQAFGHVANGLNAATLSLSCMACGQIQWQVGDYTVGGNTVSTKAGLWRECVTIGDAETCQTTDFDSRDSSYERNIKAMRALMIIGILDVFTSLIFNAMSLCCPSRRRFGYTAGAGCAFSAGLFFMIVMAIFVNDIKDDRLSYGSAFGLDIGAWILIWISCGFQIAARMKLRDESTCN